MRERVRVSEWVDRSIRARLEVMDGWIDGWMGEKRKKTGMDM